MNKLVLLFISVLTALLTACAPNVSPNTYVGAEVGVSSRVIPAVVVSMRQVSIDNETKMGGGAGIAAGGLAGSAIGNGVAASGVAAVGGAVIGGLLGHEMDKAINQRTGFEYIVKTQKGHLVSLVQEKDLKLHVGQRVLILYGVMTRIIPDHRSQRISNTDLSKPPQK